MSHNKSGPDMEMLEARMSRRRSLAMSRDHVERAHVQLCAAVIHAKDLLDDEISQSLEAHRNGVGDLLARMDARLADRKRYRSDRPGPRKTIAPMVDTNVTEGEG